MKLNLQTKMVVVIVGLLASVCLAIGISTVINVRQQLSLAITEKAISDTQTSLEIIDLLYPGPWINQNGILYKGNVKINDNSEIVDKIANLTKNTVTVFLHDTRVATTIIQDGRRAVGTKAADNVADAVLKKGRNYLGEAQVLGINYHANYTPIKDANGQVIGMFYEGVSKQFADELERGFILSFVGVVLVSLLLSSLVGWYLGRKIARPIVTMAGMVEQIAAGNLTVNVNLAGVAGDEVGQLATTFNNMTTQLRKREESLKTANKQLADIIEFLPDATCIINKDKKIIAWNRAMEEMTNVPKTDIIGKDHYCGTIPFYGEPRPFLMDLIDQDNDELAARYDYVQRKGNVLCSEVFVPALYNNTGAYIWATASPLLDNDGNIIGIIEAVRDITERKRSEAALRQAYDELEIKVEQRTQELSAMNQELTAMYQELQEANQVLQTEIADRKWAEKQLEQKNEELGKAYAGLKSAQSQLVQQEKLAGIGQLAAGVAHEINNPLGFVLSNFETLQKYIGRLLEMMNVFRELHKQVVEEKILSAQQTAVQITAMEKQKKLDYILEDLEPIFQETNEGLNRVANIVKALRLFSRVDQKNQFEEYDLNEGVKNSLTVARNEVKYVAEVQQDLTPIPPIKAIGSQINQVILNIILNATHAIKAKGLDSLGLITIKTYADERFAYCSIEDNGTGIPEEARKDIFNPFFTTKPVGEGTGLGLSISYDIIVNKHHGEISFISEVGVGTVFIIKLPLVQ
ncbi:cache domain-containing protein [Sporomusa carbonis]|uniref:cache domain-containing protein n=1 Tax=Sporomusa carbonis TaxID=3076075 RepID=UPI003C7EB959